MKNIFSFIEQNPHLKLALLIFLDFLLLSYTFGCIRNTFLFLLSTYLQQNISALIMSIASSVVFTIFTVIAIRSTAQLWVECYSKKKTSTNNPEKTSLTDNNSAATPTQTSPKYQNNVALPMTTQRYLIWNFWFILFAAFLLIFNAIFIVNVSYSSAFKQPLWGHLELLAFLAPTVAIAPHFGLFCGVYYIFKSIWNLRKFYRDNPAQKYIPLNNSNSLLIQSFFFLNTAIQYSILFSQLQLPFTKDAVFIITSLTVSTIINLFSAIILCYRAIKTKKLVQTSSNR